MNAQPFEVHVIKVKMGTNVEGAGFLFENKSNVPNWERNSKPLSYCLRTDNVPTLKCIKTCYINRWCFGKMGRLKMVEFISFSYRWKSDKRSRFTCYSFHIQQFSYKKVNVKLDNMHSIDLRWSSWKIFLLECFKTT